MITGASGFAGKHILQTLMQFEHKDLQLVAATRNPENLPSHYQGEVRVGDLRDHAYLDRVLTGIDVICHAAGWTNYTHDDAASSKNYLEPTIDLINRAKEWRVSRFVNLSSIAVMNHKQRHRDDAIGHPRRGCAMLNNIIAVEAYLKSQTGSNMSIINLRAGIYSGQGIHLGLLPLLAQRPRLPLISGKYGFLPVVDGRDIGQAFARAALLPDVQGYLSLSITGPETPQQKTVMQFLQKKMQNNNFTPAILPAAIALPLHKLLQLASYKQKNPITTCTITASLVNPYMDNTRARQILGYQPQISWQASIEDFAAEFMRNTSEVGLVVKEKAFVI